MALIRVSLGELLDRVTILELKLEHQPPVSVMEEHRSLALLVKKDWPRPELPGMSEEMLAINRDLWRLEDQMANLLEAGGDHEVATCGREIARANRRRSDCKRRINEVVGQAPEFKTYGNIYTQPTWDVPRPLFKEPSLVG